MNSSHIIIRFWNLLNLRNVTLYFILIQLFSPPPQNVHEAGAPHLHSLLLWTRHWKWHQSFSSHNLENLSIADQATSFFNRTFYKYIQLESDIKILSLNYEAIHFIMTTAWLVLGGMFQTSVIVKNIQNQAYIPLIWKVAIIMSSVFMMGPLFISYFSIFTILVSNGSILDKKRSLLLVGSIIKQDQFKLFAFCWMILHNKSSKLLFLNPYLHGKADFAPLLIFTVNDQKRITISYHFLWIFMFICAESKKFDLPNPSRGWQYKP